MFYSFDVNGECKKIMNNEFRFLLTISVKQHFYQPIKKIVMAMQL